MEIQNFAFIQQNSIFNKNSKQIIFKYDTLSF